MSPRREVSTADGFRVSYLVEGDGPALLMVPAMLQTAEHWLERGYVEAFVGDHRVVVLDPLGHGESDRPHDSEVYGAEAAVDHIASVIEQEGLERVTMWGYGSGAESTLDTARRRPHLVQAAIVGGLYLGDYAAGLRTLGLDLRALTERSAAALEAGDWQAYFDIIPWTVTPEQVERVAAENDPHAVAAMVRSNLRRARGFLVPSAPTFAYWGNDEFFAEENQRVADSFPITWGAFPGGRADVFDFPAPVIARVRRFLDANVKA